MVSTVCEKAAVHEWKKSVVKRIVHNSAVESVT